MQTRLLVNITMPRSRCVVLKGHCHELRMCEFMSRKQSEMFARARSFMAAMIDLQVSEIN